MDTAKAGRYVDCHSCELVIVGPCRRFRDLSATSVPQPWGYVLKSAVSFKKNELSLNVTLLAYDRGSVKALF